MEPFSPSLPANPLSPDELLQIRDRLLAFRLAHGHTGAMFTVGPEVETRYGEARGTLDSKRALIEYAIDIANGEAKRGPQPPSVTSRRMSKKTREAFGRENVNVADLDRLAFEHATLTRFRRFLSSLLSADQEESVDEFFENGEAGVNETLSLPEFRITPKGMVLTHHTVLMDLAAFDAFVWHLLLNDDVKSDLRRCELKRCEKFFLLAQRRGRTPRYCCTNHMKLDHDLKAPERTEASRAGETADDWRKIKEKYPGMTPVDWKKRKRKTK